MHATTCSAPDNPKKAMCPLSLPQTEMVLIALSWSSQNEATADHVGIWHDKSAHPWPDAADVTYQELWILNWPPTSSSQHTHRDLVCPNTSWEAVDGVKFLWKADTI